MSDRILIVGASHAGVQLAASLRDKGHDGPITIVGAEPHFPYHRPPLSKAFLSGTASPESMWLRSKIFFESRDLRLIQGERVEQVDIHNLEARTASGTSLQFDQLALATGARVRRLSVPGHDLRRVIYLRDLDDADALAEGMDTAQRAVVIGGGFIGLETAAALRTAGTHVTLVEASDRLMARSVSISTSAFYAGLHKRRGTDVRLNRCVVALEGDGETVSGVTLDDDSTLPADLVVVGIGVEPRTELAQQMGLQIDGGIVVDEHARTSDLRVVAVGDATVLPHPLEPGVRVRLESVQNATDQSKVAADTLMGRHSTYDAVPWFWSDQFELKLQMAGAATSYDDVAVRGSMEEGRFTVLWYREGRLVGGECINAGGDFIAIRRALAAGTSFPRNQAVDAAIPLKSLL